MADNGEVRGSHTSGDYEVGYGKPPQHTRWRKGQSGNSKGRRKGARGLKTDLDNELRAQVSIRINGKTVKGTTQQLMLRTLATRAASGDVRATKLLVELILQVFGAGDRGRNEGRLSNQDQTLLDRFLGLLDADASEAPRADDGSQNEELTNDQPSRS